MINKKIFGIAIIIIIISLLIIPVASGSTPGSMKATPDNSVNIVEGKITNNGVLFLILEKVPAMNSYDCIQTPAHDPNFEIIIYNPNPATNITLNIASWAGMKNGTLINPTWSNQTFTAPQKQVIQDDFTVPFTTTKENMTMEINGIGYQFEEQKVKSVLFPFYSYGELGFFGFVSIITAITIIISFGTALIMLKRAKYFPRISGYKITFMILIIVIIIIDQTINNYYKVITQEWYYWEIPVFLIMLLIFLSYIPPFVKRGILIRFLAEFNREEAYTEIFPVLTAESENTEAPPGYRSANMEYIKRKSYIDFIKRLIGIKTEIVFQEGQLPDEIATPLTTAAENDKKMKDFILSKKEKPKKTGKKQKGNKLKRLVNRKREPTDYDYGYLLDHIETIEIKKMERESRFKLRKKYMIIPLSGHHSSYIEDFLAGLKDSVLKGDKVSDYKIKNAELKASIMNGTYITNNSIIDELGTILKLSQKDLEPRKEDMKKEEEKLRQEEEKNDKQDQL